MLLLQLPSPTFPVNRYAYGWMGVDYWRQTLLKKDLENTANYATWFRESHYPGEVFFIPNPEGEAEDDGVIISLVFDGVREQSYVLLLDGRTFEELNTAYLPHNIPSTLVATTIILRSLIDL